jgi:Domain of unknown function (DUF4395)
MSTQVMRAVDEHRVRAAAGTTMVAGAVAFAYAYFRQLYWPLQAVSAFFTLEFAMRLAVGLRRSPVGLLAGLLTRRHVPEWVSVRPKRFAWTLGLVMAAAMAIITNSGIRGWLPRSICLLCLALMWLESAAGLCLGCEIHYLLVRRQAPARHAAARSRAAAAITSVDLAPVGSAPAGTAPAGTAPIDTGAGGTAVAECAHGACAPVRAAEARP